MSDLTFRAVLERYAQRVETGEIVRPSAFLQRCEQLRRRGLRGRIVDDLRASASATLLRQVESLTAEQIRELNAASVSRENDETAAHPGG